MFGLTLFWADTILVRYFRDVFNATKHHYDRHVGILDGHHVGSVRHLQYHSAFQSFNLIGWVRG